MRIEPSCVVLPSATTAERPDLAWAACMWHGAVHWRGLVHGRDVVVAGTAGGGWALAVGSAPASPGALSTQLNSDGAWPGRAVHLTCSMQVIHAHASGKAVGTSAATTI